MVEVVNRVQGLGQGGGRNATSIAEDMLLIYVGQTSGMLLDCHPLSCRQPVQLTTLTRTARADNASQRGLDHIMETHLWT